MPSRSRTSITISARRLRARPTPAEAVFWELVRKRRIEGRRFLRQYVIAHGGARTANRNYIIDFYCAALRLCVEIDGRVHDGEQQRAYDAERDAYLREAGYYVVRYTNERVLEQPQIVRRELCRVVKALSEDT